MTRRPNTAPVYLDYQATTPTDPRVLAAMLPWFTEKFGNPHSSSHAYGREAADAVERARAEIAGLIGADPREIVFTSGATESNNLAIKGAVRFRRELMAGARPHVVTVATEHKCVLESCRALEREGAELTVLPVGPDGLIEPRVIEGAIGERTVLVTVMAANNEIGVVQPLAEIGALCRGRGILFHTDAAQAVGKVPIDVEAMSIDLLSISGHKVYAPKGIGALYVRRRPRARLAALIDGGGQERGLRSGTLPTPLCVGLGAACAIAAAEMPEESRRLGMLRHRFLDRIRSAVPEVRLNGDPERRLPGNLNLAFAGVDAEALMADCPGLALSTGSACSSAAIEPSYVLRALGLDAATARGAVRIGFGRQTTVEEIDFAADALAAAVRRLRAGRVRNGAAATI
jgi:cysteine desulfurase